MPATVFDAIAVLALSTGCLSLAAAVGWLLLSVFRVRSPHVHRLVWGAVLVQGWLLWKIPLPLLPAETFHSPPPVQHIAQVDARSGEFAVAPFPEGAASTIAQPPANGSAAANSSAISIPLAIAAAMLVVWLGGIVVIAAHFAWRYAAFVRRLSQAAQAPEKWKHQWRAMLDEAGVTTTIPLLLHDAGPMLCRLPAGYRLVVPADLWTALSAAQRRAILRHELAHFQRGDVVSSLLVRVLMLPHWFNPLAHAAVRRFDEAAEWACDDAACRDQPAAATNYAHTLLDLTQRVPTAAAFGPAAGGSCLAARIRRLVHPSTKEDSRMKRISLFSLVSVLSLIGVIRLVAADQPDSPAKSATAAVEETDATAAADSVTESLPGDTATRLAARDLTAAEDPLQAPAPQATRQFKIEVAYIDLNQVFKQLDEFEKKRLELKQEVASSQNEMRRLQQKLQSSSEETRAALKQEIEELTQQKRDLFLQMEARMYEETFDRIQAEVARYAKEHDIRVVRRLKPTAEEKTTDAREILQRINRDVIYQADERIDITQEILQRLNAQSAPDVTR